MNGLANTVREVVVKASADVYAGDPASDVVSLEEYQGVVFEIDEAAGATGTATVTVEECTAADGTGATAIAFRYRTKDIAGTWGEWTDATASGFTTTAGADKQYEIDLRSDELSDGSPFVRLQLTESVDSPVAGQASARCYGARYAEEVPVSGLG